MSHPNHDHEGGMAMSHYDHHGHALGARDISDSFSRDAGGLPSAASPETVNLRDEVPYPRSRNQGSEQRS